MSFTEKKTSRKGALGESIVDRHLMAKGYIPYRPVMEDIAHPFDRLFAKFDKKTIFIGDSKAKAARTYYPDTGFDLKHYLIYKYAHFHHSLDTYMSFVDEKMGKVYGQFLSILDVRRRITNRGKDIWYPLTEHNQAGEIRYFPISAMEIIGDIEDDECLILKELSSRNPAYDDDFDELFK